MTAIKAFINRHLVLLLFLAFFSMAWGFAEFTGSIAHLCDRLLVSFDESSDLSKSSIASQKNKPGMKEHLSVHGVRSAPRKPGAIVADPEWNGQLPVLHEEPDRSGFIADSCLRDWVAVVPLSQEPSKNSKLSDLLDVPLPTLAPPAWKRLRFHAGSGTLALEFPFGKRDPRSWYGYALRTTLHAASPRDHVLLHLEHDGWAVVFWNGSEVYRSKKAAQCRRENTIVLDVPLRAGGNELMVRTASPGVRMNLRTRLTDHREEPLFFNVEVADKKE